MVNANYYFVTNVFNQHVGQGPTGLQNISIGCNEPICMPDDLALLAKQINAQLSGQVASLIDVLGSFVVNFSTTLDGVCSAIPINQSDIPININTSGVYCLNEDISNAGTLITISASDVVIDLNNHTITNSAAASSSIDIASLQDGVVIKNGVIEHTSITGIAIDGTNGLTNFNFQDLSIKMQSGIGIDLTGADAGSINNCIMSNCQQGVRLTDCANITFQSSQAKDCILKGFELITSSTCCFKECKALSTGVGNNETSNQTIPGFYTSAGFSNIFENCIANGTQGLAVLDPDSIVASFMLTGSEKCSKVINCEANNSMVGQIATRFPMEYWTKYV